MANLFANIPVPAANGPGAAVDVSAMGKSKSIVCGGVFVATVNLEFSNELVPTVWAPLATFHQSGNLLIDVAAHWIRANVSDYKSGLANVDVGSNDAGSLFVQLPGGGAPINISTIPLLKTVVAPSTFVGNIEVSEDGVSYAQIFSMQDGGSQTREFTGQFARVGGGSGEDVWLGGAESGSGGGGSSIVVQDEGVPLGSFTAVNFVGAGVTAAPGAPGVADVTIPGGGSASSLLSIYGDGSFGDHTTAGDELWTSDAAFPPPGAPAVPAGSFFPYAFFNNLTISPGDSVAVGGFTDQPTQKAVIIFVKDTLTIGAGGRIHVNGGDGGANVSGGGGAGGLGRNAIFGSIANGGNGGDGNPAFASGPGQPGSGGSDRPALSSATRIGGSGGAGGGGGVQPGGAGGVDAALPSWPYSLAIAISIASINVAIGGGNGGGGGGNSASSGGGSGGGGAGTLVIFAKNVVAPAGSLQGIGGAGGAAFSTENVPGGGGGGGTGGMIIVVTDNVTLAGITDVSGGAFSIGQGVPQFDGTTGGPGEAIGFNPMLAAQIPV